jgi:aspartyl-tRNA(Asn)/glutamyl-tRNA(Gln) amidotransferase subunit C
MDLELHSAMEGLEDLNTEKHLTNETLDYVAGLARIKIEADEKAEYSKDLESIIAFADQLTAIDTTGIEAMQFVSEDKNKFREDMKKDSLSVEEVLKNAPSQHESFFSVPTSDGGQ